MGTFALFIMGMAKNNSFKCDGSIGPTKDLNKTNGVAGGLEFSVLSTFHCAYLRKCVTDRTNIFHKFM